MSTRSLSRRQFLKAASLTVAGITLTGAGLGVVATRAPALNTPKSPWKEQPQ